MRFDWYAVAIQDSHRNVVETLLKTGHEVVPCNSLAKAYHYSEGVEIRHNTKGPTAKVFWKDGQRPYAFASSEATDQFVDVVRSTWGDLHYVTRADATQDFLDPLARRAITRHMRRIGKQRRMVMEERKDPLKPLAGKTTYLGSPTSEYRCRGYDKGLEQLGKIQKQLGRIGVQDEQMPQDIQLTTPDGSTVNAVDWFRLELQARPADLEARQLMATLEPEQVWAMSEWTRDLAQAVFQLELDQIYFKSRRMSADDEKLRWLLTQYDGPLSRLVQACGSWGAAGETLGHMYAELQAERSKMKR